MARLYFPRRDDTARMTALANQILDRKKQTVRIGSLTVDDASRATSGAVSLTKKLNITNSKAAWASVGLNVFEVAFNPSNDTLSVNVSDRQWDEGIDELRQRRELLERQKQHRQNIETAKFVQRFLQNANLAGEGPSS